MMIRRALLLAPLLLVLVVMAAQVAHGLDPNDPYVAMEDPEQDGLTNLEEYQYGTDPNNRSGRKARATGENVVTVTLEAAAGPPWLTVTAVLHRGEGDLVPLPSCGLVGGSSRASSRSAPVYHSVP